MTNGFNWRQFPGSSPWQEESWWRITWRTTWSEMRSKASWLRLLLKDFCTILVNNFLLHPGNKKTHPSWATPRHDGNIRIILTEKANLAVGRPAIGGLPRKSSRFKFADPAWTHHPIQRCYEPWQISGHKEHCWNERSKMAEKRSATLHLINSQKCNLSISDQRPSSIGQSAVSWPNFTHPFQTIEIQIRNKWRYLKLLTCCHQLNIYQWSQYWKDYCKAWSDGAAHCIESTSQGWHRPGCTLLAVMSCKGGQWTRITPAAPDTAALSTSCLFFRSSWPLLLLHQPIISFLCSMAQVPLDFWEIYCCC